MLNENQYSSSDKYEARIYLHRKFRTSSKSKYEWIFDHFPKEENLSVLELGCGTGLFWLANRNSIIKSWSITLSDYSEGMLKTTKSNLLHLKQNFKYEIVNADSINYSDNLFDIILANNMLYHLQNIDIAIKNIHRILKETGVFIASTFGKKDLMELNEYLYHFLESKNNRFRFREYVFSLDNGREQLKKYFNNVILEKHENRLLINEADAIVNYYLSFNEIHEKLIILPDKYKNEFEQYLKNVLKQKNVIETTKDEGIFICRK
jgi:ubiquinone/menaquinone biosynthesis C-methylase UbiE